MPNDLVSVVIDNYNYGRFLSQCVQSVLDQDYPRDRFEVIVVDDGSTDDSREVASRFGDHIRLIAQDNKGQAGAFNTGFAAAKGNVVCLMDSDDYWEPSKLRCVMPLFEDPAVGIVQHYLRDVNGQGRALANPLPPWPPRYGLENFLSGSAAFAATSGLAFRKELLLKLIPVPSEIYYHFDIYLLVHGLFLTSAANVERVLGYHRIHGQNNWAETYSSPRKLEMGLIELHAFRRYLDPKLESLGLRYSDFYRFLEDLEIKRREILLAMHQGHRAAAFDLWRRLWRQYGRSAFGSFRCATLLIALISPRLYLNVYDIYRNQRWLVRLRGFLIRE